MTVRVIRDISQRVKMEKQILQSNSELSNFAYMVSHDLKSPLGIIAGYLEVINEEPASFNEHYQTIIKQIDWAGKFIDRLLKLSRAGIVIDKKNMVNVRTLVEDTLYQLNTAEMPLVVNYSTPLPDITGDPDKLSQVFLNLISNSIKHQDAQKEQLVLEISHRQEDNHDLIIYRDNGAGIKRELLHRIFEAGFTSRKGDGTGFGLAISRKIIEAHGGIMRAESQGEGQGAEFYIKLPR